MGTATKLLAGILTLSVLAAVPATAAENPAQAVVDEFVAQGAPGAMVFAGDGRHSWSVTSGTGQLGKDDPIRPWHRIRVGSNTKMFVAAVVLQLAGENRVLLDAPIERYLPGVVQGNGYDGNRVSVRQLLRHTGGLAEYTKDVMVIPGANDRVWPPEELVRIGLSHPPLFEPGAGWAYSNTGYLLLGMLIEAVTGNGIGEEIKNRIIRPLQLWQTSYPEPGEKRIRGPHAHGYFAFPGQPIMDLTELEPSLPGAAAAMVSTGPDLTRFVRALLGGRVLRPDLLGEMLQTVPAPGGKYGLGIREYQLSCGTTAWGHAGTTPGFDSFTAVAADGRGAFAVANGPAAKGVPVNVRLAVDTALCAETVGGVR